MLSIYAKTKSPRVSGGFVLTDRLAAAADRTRDHVELLFLGELDEVHSVARHADGELGILLGVFHCIIEEVTVEDVDVEVLTTVGREVTVHEVHEVFHL